MADASISQMDGPSHQINVGDIQEPEDILDSEDHFKSSTKVSTPNVPESLVDHSTKK